MGKDGVVQRGESFADSLGLLPKPATSVVASRKAAERDAFPRRMLAPKRSDEWWSRVCAYSSPLPRPCFFSLSCRVARERPRRRPASLRLLLHSFKVSTMRPRS